MNSIAGFRKCTLSNKQLMDAVDSKFDEIYKKNEIPSRHIPARPNEDLDLLIGELLIRFKEYEAAQAEHDAEVWELVEALKEIEGILDKELGDTDPYIGEDWSDDDVKEEEPLLFAMWQCVGSIGKYRQIDCPECGGSGDKSIGEDVNGNEMCYPCPTCKGSGKVWRRK